MVFHQSTRFVYFPRRPFVFSGFCETRSIGFESLCASTESHIHDPRQRNFRPPLRKLSALRRFSLRILRERSRGVLGVCRFLGLVCLAVEGRVGGGYARFDGFDVSMQDFEEFFESGVYLWEVVVQFLGFGVGEC